MLVSLHLPKTAGTSFLAALQLHYGGRLLTDYADQPLHRSRWSRRSRALLACAGNAVRRGGAAPADCVHGHFLALKYRSCRARPGLRFVTWMRDPVERIASHYHYWRASYDPKAAGTLHRRVVEDQWDLERFCFAPELRNLYSEFLWCVPLSHFSFVGITEQYDAELESFANLFLSGATMTVANENRSRQHVDVGSMGAARHIEDPALRRRIEAYHAPDVQLYRQALRMREARLAAE